MDQLQRKVLASLLYERLNTAVNVLQVGDKINNWTAKPGCCHENVVAWLNLHPNHFAVRGWLDASYMAIEGIARFASHSVIKTEVGELIDITLPSTECKHPFIFHPGSDEEFVELVHNNGAPWLDHQIEGYWD